MKISKAELSAIIKSSLMINESEDTLFDQSGDAGASTGLVGDVYDGPDLMKKRPGLKISPNKISDKKIVDLFEKIMNGGFWLSATKGSKTEIMTYQKFLSSLNYDVDIDGYYGKETKKETKALQSDIDANYEEYSDSKFKKDGIFGISTLKMLIASLKDSKIDASHNSFVRAFPNATTAHTVRTWLTSQYDVIGLKNTKNKKNKQINTLQQLIDSQLGPRNRALPDYQIEFFNKYPALIIQAANETVSKIFPSLSIAQAALESGWGRKVPGGNSNNLFGIKATDSAIKYASKTGNNPYWDGSSIDSKTKEEYTPGEKTNITSAFRSYNTEIDSVKDHDRLLNKSKYYTSTRSAASPEAQANTLTGVYATSSSYGAVLIKLINNYNLKEYDKFRNQAST